MSFDLKNFVEAYRKRSNKSYNLSHALFTDTGSCSVLFPVAGDPQAKAFKLSPFKAMTAPITIEQYFHYLVYRADTDDSFIEWMLGLPESVYGVIHFIYKSEKGKKAVEKRLSQKDLKDLDELLCFDEKAYSYFSRNDVIEILVTFTKELKNSNKDMFWRLLISIWYFLYLPLFEEHLATDLKTLLSQTTLPKQRASQAIDNDSPMIGLSLFEAEAFVSFINDTIDPSSTGDSRTQAVAIPTELQLCCMIQKGWINKPTFCLDLWSPTEDHILLDDTRDHGDRHFVKSGRSQWVFIGENTVVKTNTEENELIGLERVAPSIQEDSHVICLTTPPHRRFVAYKERRADICLQLVATDDFKGI
ncbi:hypothetical protein ACQZV8_11460 [Magnetococcales bacterium HHB-1]